MSNDRPPVRYDEEGKSLPERGSGIPALEAALAKQQPMPAPEPEKLVIPAQATMWLLMKALQSPEGDAWMRGFVTAHGEPSWIVNGQWGIRADQAEVVRVERQNGAAR
jgi:hypothetical protein